MSNKPEVQVGDMFEHMDTARMYAAVEVEQGPFGIKVIIFSPAGMQNNKKRKKKSWVEVLSAFLGRSI